MKTIRATFILPAVAIASMVVASISSCVAFNEECARFMEDPEGIAGYLAGEVKIGRSEVRLRDNPIGQVVADAYYNAFNNLDESKLPHVAITNGGSIREDGLCEARSVLEKGPLRRKVLRDILPFDNNVLLTTISYERLKNILEHSIAFYQKNDPQGSYLQVSGIRVTMDCSKKAEVMSNNGEQRVSEGERVVKIELKRRGCDPSTSDDCYSVLNQSASINLALDSYIYGGGDQFEAFDDTSAKTVTAGAFNFDLVAKYFAETYPESAPLPEKAEERIILLNCGENE